jgi:hypothetical protein
MVVIVAQTTAFADSENNLHESTHSRANNELEVFLIWYV